MPRYLIFGLCLVAPLALADTPSSPDSEQDLSYSLGASLGERLRQEVPGLQLDALVEGLRAAYEDRPLKLDSARMQAILQAHEERSGEAQMDKALLAEKRFMANERSRAGVHELADGVLYSEIAAGTGAQPTAQGRVKVRYVGKLPDGSVFDQNQQAQWFRLDSVIGGWQVAVPHMKIGARWRLVIPSDQAYGAEGAGDLIAPYTPLVFEIELLEVAD
ncbi:FKBP-type peptidyl-prolyl cis-trans isomerase [Pseudomonas capeferrum]|uniref:FKBP-type peptidyl-prolyl cis-trans isomerase n=1 Tax=Pseudomonas capeferrum TaxID=1495066 RepID=UPI0015E33708|nr:FKBP-type peptidyl-prolyl cis-trans isomerase [Pseudomonas capeferrum]MBA1202214.1 FKBP-type peptidyl-prolyl cis-trans isomerase [Pseudomonas capeferrum]